jgi:flagellar biosynthetic protein FliR
MIQMNFGFGPLEAEFWRMVFLMTRCGAALFAAPLFGSRKCRRKCAWCSPAAWR